MATTYELISSNILSGTAASVSFSAIPSTYTDLCLKMSVRDTDSATARDVYLTFNGNTSSLYSRVILRGNSSAASSSLSSSVANINLATATDAANATSNTFSNAEIYIPSYTSSNNKPVSAYQVTENSGASAGDAFIRAQASLFRDTTAISSITLSAYVNFVSGSSFYLYGIKNS